MKKPRKPKAKRAATGASKAQPAPARTPSSAPPHRPSCASIARHRRVRSAPARPAAGRPALGSVARAFPGPFGAVTGSASQVGALADSFEQRELVTLLLMPFVLLAFALGMSQTWRHPMRVAQPTAVPMRPRHVRSWSRSRRPCCGCRRRRPRSLLRRSSCRRRGWRCRRHHRLSRYRRSSCRPRCWRCRRRRRPSTFPPSRLPTPLRLPLAPPPVDPPEIKVAVPLIELPRTRAGCRPAGPSGVSGVPWLRRAPDRGPPGRTR